MAKEPPSLDGSWGELPFQGEKWVIEFEISNGFSGISATYNLLQIPFDRFLDMFFSPKGEKRTPEERLSVLSFVVDELLAMNPNLQVPARDRANFNAEEALIRTVAGGCNPEAVNYEVQRQVNYADPDRRDEQKRIDEQQQVRLARLAKRFEETRGAFKPPAVFWNISPDDMTTMERQADEMLPRSRPTPKPKPRGPRGF